MNKISEKKELSQVRRALNAFLAENGTKLFWFCEQYAGEFPYQRTYQRLTRASIGVDEVDSIIKKINPKKSLQKVNEIWVIR